MALRDVLFVSVTLAFTFGGCLCGTASTPRTTTTSPVDISTAAKQLVKDIRTTVSAAKYGQYIHLMYQDVLDLEFKATKLLESLPGEVSECETNLVIKMAAAGTGSHEVLTLMLAENPMSVLNGRLALSLAFLEHLAGQLEDELTRRSSDLGPQLSAIVFGASTTAGIIDTADKTLKAIVPLAHPRDSQNNNYNHNYNYNGAHNRVRRQFDPNVNLGGGWSAGLGGIKWNSNSGMTTFTVKPTFKPFKITGVNVKLVIRF